MLAPPPDDDEFQIIFRFADEQTLHAWEHSVSRTAWLGRGGDLFAHGIFERQHVGVAQRELKGKASIQGRNAL